MSKVKVGVIGLGNMGKFHAKQLDQGQIEGAELLAVCGRDYQVEWVQDNLADRVKFYEDEDTFFNDSEIEAVIIVTPHYSHPEIAIKAFKKGIHVLLEKPAGVYTKNVAVMNEVAKQSGKVFSMMYNQRANPLFQALRELIQEGELGEIKRINWIITDWYRPQSYYDSSEWRGTWKGEGGGVLLNQATHQLDLLQWTTDLMPKEIRAFASHGKYHNIEVEDDVTAYLEYENGATGVIVASTGEIPGTNRLEIAGEHGKIVIENNEITFYKLFQTDEGNNTNDPSGYGIPDSTRITVPVEKETTNSHSTIIQNWIDAIQKGTSLIAPGEEGIRALEIINAIYLSSWLNQSVQLPVDADLYYEKLQEQIK